MEQKDLDMFREQLEKERAVLEKELAAHGKNVGGDWQGRSDDYGATSADSNEVADQIEELVTAVPMVEDLEERYHNVVAALEKIAQGTYGTCEVGGEEIPMERLKANPSARTCIAHAPRA